MAVISEAATQATYDIAKQIYDGTIKQRVGLDYLERDFGLSRGSAANFIGNFKQMRSGVFYTRTMNEFATRLFIASLAKDYGFEAGRVALEATRGHLIYYEGASGSRLIGISKICDEAARDYNCDDRDTFASEVIAAKSLSTVQRAAAIGRYPLIPEWTSILIRSCRRNPYVVVDVLERADGICEQCQKPAPFNRMSDGRPFLEVHHIKQLSHGGEDSTGNAIAICPNCHRERHFG